MRRYLTLLACLLLLVPAVAAAKTRTGGKPAAATTFTIEGAGNGHGIGMSQYGALGFAEHGYSYTQILAHYYRGTVLGHLDHEPTVTVLLKDGSLTFTGATAANGHPLKANRRFGVIPSGGRLQLISGGRKLGRFTPPLVITGTGPIDVIGMGPYRGSLVLRPDGSGGVETVNALGLEDYVRGVIAGESPSSWPAAALEAQAVAARSYVVADQAVNPDYMVYDDTRSQMYGGVSSETPSTDAATAATAGQIVQYAGLPIPTYFFSSSGGYTESIQNVWLGTNPLPYLVGEPDPYDNAGGNPYYRWSRSMPMRAAEHVLRGLYSGRLLGIKVLQTGVSPRIVSAEVVGSRGSDRVSGPQLQSLFGTISTYMRFITISATTGTVSTPGSTGSTGSAGSGGGATPTASSGSKGTTTTGTTTTPASSSGGGSGSGGGGLSAQLRRALGSLPAAVRVPLQWPTLSGDVFPLARGRHVRVWRLEAHGRRKLVGFLRPSASGEWSLIVPGRGRYRVTYGKVSGPVLTVP